MARLQTAILLLGLMVGLPAWSQSSNDETPTEERNLQRKHERGAAREIGAGVGTVGVGAAKGAGDLAVGAGKGAVDLVTLHPVDAAASVGTGAVKAGKDVAVGTVKGTGKVTKGVGRALKHVL
jgi:hypothetical protein